MTRLCLVASFFVASARAFAPSASFPQHLSRDSALATTPTSMARLAKHPNRDVDEADEAEPLSLSLADVARLAEMHSRTVTMPIIIMDTLLPDQKLTFESADPKFQKLIEHAQESSDGEIGMIGFNPHSGAPLNVGVTFSLNKGTISKKPLPFSRALRMNVTGRRRFEVLGEPWLDETGSFYLATVDIVDNRHEAMTPELEAQTSALHAEIPQMVNEWVGWIVKAKKATQDAMKQRLQELGPIPKSPQKRAIWVGALVNPATKTVHATVCPEIRPAMLSCRHDHDRLVLASTALRCSIDHMAGRTQLFD